ncbi:carboxymuconolactone decarboxylase family protein [Paracoccus sp. S-4012]|uniref:carboxymuconolactone decarboxylase family protein n=1 Tax=Paracoccus sp. S-4012 TaxID=2665648 RepID=UPI0012B0DCEB|nr:carboxymuconolactone decarboxylase family protein [Paracoccus sp. S-4012]MRX50428.1 carboxymuconolactone decarboxylase family protein [Paracoccus sp. S-4012]
MPDPTSLKPLGDAELPTEIAELREGFAGALNVYRTMAHHPALLRAWAPLRQHVVKESALGALRSEVVILRAAYHMGSSYEWSHHVYRALQLGMEDRRIAALGCEQVEGEDALIARAVDELFTDRRLSRETEAALSTELGREAVFDLMATVGFYSILGFILMTYDTPLDDDVAEELRVSPLS